MNKCRKWFCDFMKGIEVLFFVFDFQCFFYFFVFKYLHDLRIGHADLKPGNFYFFFFTIFVCV